MPETPDKKTSWTTAGFLRLTIALCILALTGTYIAEKLRPEWFPRNGAVVSIEKTSPYDEYSSTLSYDYLPPGHRPTYSNTLIHRRMEVGTKFGYDSKEYDNVRQMIDVGMPEDRILKDIDRVMLLADVDDALKPRVASDQEILDEAEKVLKEYPIKNPLPDTHPPVVQPLTPQPADPQ